MNRLLWLIKGNKTYSVGIFFIAVSSYLYLKNQLSLEFGIYLLICEYALLSMTKRNAMPKKQHQLRDLV